MTTLGLVRHGVTEWNKIKRTQGHANNPLDQEGITQAQAVADRLAKEKWDVLYSSDLLRARQTAEIILKKLRHKDIRFEQGLREMHRGQIEGTIEEERINKWGRDWRQLDLGLETAKEAAERGVAALQELVTRHRGESVLLVSHGAIIHHTLTRIFPEKDLPGPLDNTSVTIIQVDDEHWNCELYNCNKHLAGMTRSYEL